MPDTLQHVLTLLEHCTDTEAKAAYKELCKARGKTIFETPCEIGSNVYTIEENYFDCENCQFGNESKYDPLIQQPCCDLDANTTRHCPYEIRNHVCEEFDITGEPGKIKVSNAGEWGCEGIEYFVGIDDQQYYSETTAREALELLNKNT